MAEITCMKRLFIGGLFKSVLKDDLSNLFKSFGEVGDVTIIQRSACEGQIDRTFGYVNLTTTEQKLNKCLGVFGKTKWKGHELRVQVAKEDFMARLKVEREDAKNGSVTLSKRKKKNLIAPPKPYNVIVEKVSTMKRVVPGTLIDGEKDWVVGKYGRPLPVMKLEAKTGKKSFKFDPSKQCHCLKVIKDDNTDNVGIKGLTWSLDNDELYFSSKKKKRKKDKGDDSNLQSKSKKTKHCIALDSDKHSQDKRIKLLKCSTESGQTKNSDSLETETQLDTSEDVNVKSVEIVMPSTTENTIKEKKDYTVECDIPIKNSSNSNNTLENIEFEEFWIGKQQPMVNDLQTEESNGIRLGMSIVEQILAKEKQSDTCDSTKLLNQPCEATHVAKCEIHNVEVTTEIEGISNDSGEFFIDNRDTLHVDIPVDCSASQVFNKTDLGEVNVEVINTSCMDQPISSAPNTDIHSVTSFAVSNASEKVSEIKGVNSLESDLPTVTLSDGATNSNKSESIGLSSSNKTSSTNNFTCAKTSSKQHEQTIELENLLSRPKGELSKAERKLLKTLTKADRKKQKKEIEAKHKLSDEKRKESVGSRNKCIADNKQLIQQSLRDIDSSKLNSNRIVFADDSDENEECKLEDDLAKENGSAVETKDDADTLDSGTVDFEVIKTKKVVSEENGVFDLWSDVDENSSHKSEDHSDEREDAGLSGEGDDELFRLKPQFQGPKGAELFRLQQKFGGDERFRFDERFASGDEMEDAEEDSTPVTHSNSLPDNLQVEDEVDLKQEKDMAMSILEQVLGKPIVKPRENEKNLNLEHYDPTNAEHQKYEVPKEASKVSAAEQSTIENKAEDEVPQVSKETYYEVDASLKDLFSQSTENKQTPVFSFLDEQQDSFKELDQDEPQSSSKAFDQNDNTAETDRKTLNWQLALEEAKETEKLSLNCDIEEEREESVEISSEEKTMQYFFFTDGDPRLLTGKSFMRSDSLEKIEERWRSLRGQLTEDYKKKHKDALRRTRKLKEKHSIRR